MASSGPASGAMSARIGTGRDQDSPGPGMVEAWLPRVGLLLAAWAALPPYIGPALDTARRVEMADHAVPAVVVAAASLAAAVGGRRAGRASSLLLASGLVVALAGLWMTLTHVPLVAQAFRGQAPWGATVYHGAPGVAVLAFAGLWTKTYWDDASPPQGPASTGT